MLIEMPAPPCLDGVAADADVLSDEPPPLTLLLMLMPEPLLLTLFPAKTTVGSSAKPTMMAKRDAIRMRVLPNSACHHNTTGRCRPKRPSDPT